MVNDDDNLDNRGEEKLKKQLSNEGEGKNKEDKKTPGDEPGEGVSTKYRLRGIVVHSGQASGGHYYSFIQIRYDEVFLASYPEIWIYMCMYCKAEYRHFYAHDKFMGLCQKGSLGKFMRFYFCILALCA